MATDYYKILGLEKTVSQEDIKKAYRKLSLKFHPDKNGGDPFFENMFKQINEAYNVLGDPAKRSAYDRTQGGQGQTYQSSSSRSNSNQSSGPVIEVFRTDKLHFNNGEIVHFDWRTSGADHVEIKPLGVVAVSGTKAFRINNFNKEKLTVTLVATNYASNKATTRTILLTNTSFSHYSFGTKRPAGNEYTTSAGTHTESFFSLKGRLRRIDYFKRMCLLVFIGIVFGMFTPDTSKADINFFTSIVVLSIGLLMLIQSKKRLHDINLSTSYVLLLLLPIVNGFFFLYLLFSGGTQGNNNYGADPRT